jgi:ferredoxin
LAQEGIGRERIDVFLLHEQESIHTLRGHAQALEYFFEQRERGVIGAVGISTHHIAAVQAAARWDGLDVVFAILNHRGIGIVDGTLAQMESALGEARQRGRSVFAMKALGGGHLIGDREKAFSYVINNPLVDCFAVGMQSEAEIDYNVAMTEDREPDARSVFQTSRAGRLLHIQDECAGCGRCAARCGQQALFIQGGRAVARQDRCIRCGYCASVCPLFCIKVI